MCVWVFKTDKQVQVEERKKHITALTKDAMVIMWRPYTHWLKVENKIKFSD